MKRLSNCLRGRRGVTLTEVMCAGVLLAMFIAMCAGALHPAARTVWRMRRIMEAEIIADSILESVRAEVEEAREYVRVYQYDGGGAEGTDMTVCADEGAALEFVGRNGCTTLVSAGGGLETEGFGRLQYRVMDSEDGAVQEEGETKDFVFPEEFYTELYLQLRFAPILEDGALMRIKITVQLGRRLENTIEGPVVHDIICARSATASLRRAVELKDGVWVKVGLPLNPAGPEENSREEGEGRETEGEG